MVCAFCKSLSDELLGREHPSLAVSVDKIFVKIYSVLRCYVYDQASLLKLVQSLGSLAELLTTGGLPQLACTARSLAEEITTDPILCSGTRPPLDKEPLRDLCNVIWEEVVQLHETPASSMTYTGMAYTNMTLTGSSQGEGEESDIDLEIPMSPTEAGIPDISKAVDEVRYKGYGGFCEVFVGRYEVGGRVALRLMREKFEEKWRQWVRCLFSPFSLPR